MHQFKSLPSRARAFSLVELIVVIGIIVLVISIVLPALSGARNAAKVESSRSLLNEFSNSVSLFKQEKNRLPGYFSVREMGDAENATRGFSAMQNAMLELSGASIQASNASGPGILSVGPTAAKAIKIKVDDTGGGIPQVEGKSYFAQSSKFFKRQNGSDGGERTGIDEHSKLAELVDSFGQPVLMWAADVGVSGPIQSLDGNNDNALARAASSAASNVPPARFYWNSNAAFLTASPTKFIGAQRKAQGGNSWITSDQTNYIKNLSVMLGNPGAPTGITKPYDQILPSSQRGDFIVQSAGKNFVYMGTGELTRGYADASNNQLLYGGCFKDPAGGARTDSNGKPSSFDIMTASDDIWLSGN